MTPACIGPFSSPGVAIQSQTDKREVMRGGTALSSFQISENADSGFPVADQ
jgi:hypothetical protein